MPIIVTRAEKQYIKIRKKNNKFNLRDSDFVSIKIIRNQQLRIERKI